MIVIVMKNLDPIHKAYETSSILKVPRALILNPQIIDPIKDPDWDKKQKGFLSLQTFKALKRVDDIIKSFHL